MYTCDPCSLASSLTQVCDSATVCMYARMHACMYVN